MFRQQWNADKRDRLVQISDLLSMKILTGKKQEKKQADRQADSSPGPGAEFSSGVLKV